MARNLTERLDADVLDEGEHWLAAQAMTLKGRRGLTSWLADHGSDGLTHRRRRHRDGQEVTVADPDLPTGLVAAVTDRRLIVFDRSLTGRPRGLVIDWPIGDVTLDVDDRGGRVQARLFVFGLADGSVFAGEAGVNGAAMEQANAFVDAFHAVSTH